MLAEPKKKYWKHFLIMSIIDIIIILHTRISSISVEAGSSYEGLVILDDNLLYSGHTPRHFIFQKYRV